VPSALVHDVYRQVARFHARPLDEELNIELDQHNVGDLSLTTISLPSHPVSLTMPPRALSSIVAWDGSFTNQIATEKTLSALHCRKKQSFHTVCVSNAHSQAAYRSTMFSPAICS
jgi:hypothetical protein